MARYIEVQDKQAFKQHTCEGTLTKDWLIFKCPHCDYERRIHRKTNEMRVKKGDEGALHEGMFNPLFLMLNAEC